jgi:hypothetical protein
LLRERMSRLLICFFRELRSALRRTGLTEKVPDSEQSDSVD